MAWDPAQYLSFAERRLRPAVELLARVPAGDPGMVVDLGCGAGNVTRLLRQRWPDARIVGVDDSDEMLERARTDHGDLDVEWVTADAATWQPDAAPDVVYSNAALHWLDDHEELFPRLVGWLREGGWLAVQMPRNHDEPSHTEATAVARDPRWSDRLAPLVRERPVATMDVHHRLLAPITAALDQWETVYLQVMDGPDAIAEWTKGSLLRPLLAVLDESEQDAFVTAYRERLRSAYPTESDGTALFPFRRQFLVAQRGDDDPRDVHHPV